MKILLIGANSYVGSRIYVGLKEDHEITGTYHRDRLFDDLVFLDVTDQQAVAGLIAKENPEVIIHAANNASGKWCEAHPDEAQKLNQEATKYIVTAANKVNAKLVYISSFAAITAADIYGKTKKESEQITKATQAGYLIIEPGIVIGMSPKLKKEDGFFSAMIDCIDQNKSAEYDASRLYQPTYLGHIYEVIKLALEKNIWGATIPVAAPDLKSKYALATDILSSFNISVTALNSDKPVQGKQPIELTQLTESGLPIYTYREIISKTVEEIKSRA